MAPGLWQCVWVRVCGFVCVETVPPNKGAGAGVVAVCWVRAARVQTCVCVRLLMARAAPCGAAEVAGRAGLGSGTEGEKS